MVLDFDLQVGIPPGRDRSQELYHQLRRYRAVIGPCNPFQLLNDRQITAFQNECRDSTSRILTQQ